MKLHCHSALRIVIALGCLSLGTGCVKLYDPKCTDEDQLSKLLKKKQLQNKLDNFSLGGASFAPTGLAPNALAAASAAPADIRLAMKFVSAGPYPLTLDLPNTSTEKYIAQITVAYDATDGFRSRNSAGGIQWNQYDFQPASRNYFVGVRWDGANGLFAYVSDDSTGLPVGTPIPLATSHQADVRIEQTDTQLIFSGRATPAMPSAGGWTPILTLNTAPDPAPVSLKLALRNVDVGATFYFTHFAMDGEGACGVAEERVIAPLRASVAALASASGKITAATPDLAGALTDIDAATAALQSAHKELRNAFVDYTLQSQLGSRDAKKAIFDAFKDLAKVRAALVPPDPVKAKAQVAKLSAISINEKNAMANLIGFKTPKVQSLPDGLVSLGIP